MGMEGQSRLFNFVGNAFLFLFSGVHSFRANTFIVAPPSAIKPVSNQGYMYFQTRQLTMAAIRTTIGTGHHSGNIGVDCLYFLTIVSLWDYPDKNTSEIPSVYREQVYQSVRLFHIIRRKTPLNTMKLTLPPIVRTICPLHNANPISLLER